MSQEADTIGISFIFSLLKGPVHLNYRQLDSLTGGIEKPTQIQGFKIQHLKSLTTVLRLIFDLKNPTEKNCVQGH